MLIFMSNNEKYTLHNDIQIPDCIWVDDKEYMISIRPNTQFEQNQLPVEISVVPYDMIQYIQTYVPIKETLADVDTLKTHINDSQIKIINDMLSRIAPPTSVYVPMVNANTDGV